MRDTGRYRKRGTIRVQDASGQESGRGLESSDRKAEILDASMKMVCEYGLSAFTTKKVASYLGISESLFKTRERVLNEA